MNFHIFPKEIELLSQNLVDDSLSPQTHNDAINPSTCGLTLPRPYCKPWMLISKIFSYIFTVLATLNLPEDSMIQQMASPHGNGLPSRSDIARSAKQGQRCGQHVLGNTRLHGADQSELPQQKHEQVGSDRKVTDRYLSTQCA